jgi:opacity protein-like surface antigen
MTATLAQWTLVISISSALGAPALAARYQPEVVVSDPFIELHTGPGRGYPIFYVAAQGDRIQILKERTEWYKVRTPRGKEGWVNVAEMRSTLDLDGNAIEFPAHDIGDFESRRFDVGFAGGDFDGAALLSVRGAFAWTSTLSTELTVSQILGDYSDGYMGTAAIVMAPFPNWRISPYFSIGSGVVHIEPQTTVVQTEDRTDEIVHAGIGANIYLSRRFILRMEYKRHTVLTSRDDNQEIDEWKAGFSVFL